MIIPQIGRELAEIAGENVALVTGGFKGGTRPLIFLSAEFFSCSYRFLEYECILTFSTTCQSLRVVSAGVGECIARAFAETRVKNKQQPHTYMVLPWGEKDTKFQNNVRTF